jgi:GDPmannose 4,6-dehydratase
VREFLDTAFSYLGLDYSEYVVIDPKLYRPAEINLLLGDCSKARERLGWTHTQTFTGLVHEMVEADLKYFAR